MSKKSRKSVKPESKNADSFLLSAEDFRQLLDADDFSDLMAELQKPVRSAFRINPLKVSPLEDVRTWIRRYDWKLSPVEYCSTGWWVDESSDPVSLALEHKLGQFYIQDAASMLPVELFDWEGMEQPLVLDMAASPGGKTTHLNAKMEDRGLLLANDSSKDRLTALRLVLQNWGAVNAAVCNFPGEKMGSWFPNAFDRVLLDAPCSMQGLRTGESHPMRPITIRERQQLAGRQARLLASALQAVRPGGQVVYSTCTLTLDEDEGVLQAVLDQFGTAITIQDTGKILPRPAPALAGDGEKVFDPSIRGAARLWPHRFGTSGFFAALITKNEEMDCKNKASPERPLEKAGLSRLSSDEIHQLDDLLRRDFEFELEEVLEQYQLVLWRLGKNILALPEMLLVRLPDFPVQFAGLAVGEMDLDGFVVGHDWLVRFEKRFPGSRLRLDEAQSAAWLRGEDLHGLEGEGLRIVQDPQGRLMGRGRLAGGRLKNMLPKRWF